MKNNICIFIIILIFIILNNFIVQSISNNQNNNHVNNNNNNNINYNNNKNNNNNNNNNNQNNYFNKKNRDIIKIKEINKKKINLKSSVRSLLSTTNLIQKEKDILVLLYNSWSGSDWLNNDGWLIGDPCNDNWYGILCQSFDGGLTSNVIQIQLGSNNLNGQLPFEISDLIYLQVIDLSSNTLNGIIENETFLKMNNLSYLSLNDNEFEGGLEWTNYLSTTISTLWIAYNYFNSTLPTFFGKYDQLDLLFLEGNLLYGSIPTEFGNIPKLRLLDIGFNSIMGELPDNLSNLNSLESLWLYDNSLEGTIPKSFGQLQNLVLFEVTRNKLHGTLDNIFINNPRLSSLRFSDNKFSGSLQWVCEITSLRDIALDINQFTSLPDCVDKIPILLNDVILNSNKIQGTIPESMGDWIGLEYLNLANNNITGIIPMSFKNISNLNRISLDNNNFNCSLSEILDPIKGQKQLTIVSAQNNQIYGEFIEDMVWDSVEQVELLTKLFIFNFKSNNLSGELKTFLSWLPNLNELDFSNNNFNGPIPSELSYLSTLYLENNPLLRGVNGGELPEFMKPSDTFIHFEDNSFSCPQIVGNGVEMRISIDASYYNYSYCKCDVSYRGINGSCKLCPENSICPGSNSILVPKGFYPFPIEDPQYILACPISNFGKTSCNPDNSYNYTCREGYEGRLCSQCKENYFQKGLECSKCPNGWQSTLIFIVVVAIFIVLFLFFVLTSPKRSLPSSTRKTVVFFYQIFNLLLSKSPWPSFFTGFYSGSSWLNFSFGFLCIGSLPKWPNLFIVIISLPFIFFALSIIFICLMQMYNYLKTKGNCVIDKNYFYSGIRVNLLILNILYLPLTTYTFQNFPCQQDSFSGTKYMSFFPYIECGNNSKYDSTLRLSIASTILYVIGIPALFSFILLRNRNRLDNPIILKMYGSIYIDYRKSVYWYELLTLLRRFLLSVSLALINPKSAFSVFVVLLVIGSSIINQIMFKPYVYKISNLAEVTGNSVLLFCYIIVLILSSLQSTKLYDHTGIEVILCIVVVSYCILLGLLFIFSLKYYLPTKLQFVVDSKILKFIDFIKHISSKYLSNDIIVQDPEDSYETSKEPIFERTASTLHGIELKRRASQMSLSNSTTTHNIGDYGIKVSRSHQQLSVTPPLSPLKEFNSAPNLVNLTNNNSLSNLSTDNNNNSNGNSNNNNENTNNNTENDKSDSNQIN